MASGLVATRPWRRIRPFSFMHVNEAIELDRYKVEMEKLRVRRHELEGAVQDIDRRECHEADSRLALEHLERFCSQVALGRDTMTFQERQQLLRFVVERITVANGAVWVETVSPRTTTMINCVTLAESLPALSEVEGSNHERPGGLAYFVNDHEGAVRNQQPIP